MATSQVAMLRTAASRRLQAIMASRNAEKRMLRTRLNSHSADGHPTSTIITMT